MRRNSSWAIYDSVVAPKLRVDEAYTPWTTVSRVLIGKLRVAGLVRGEKKPQCGKTSFTASAEGLLPAAQNLAQRRRSFYYRVPFEIAIHFFSHSQFFCDKSIDVFISSLILSGIFSVLTTVSSSSFFMTNRKHTSSLQSNSFFQLKPYLMTGMREKSLFLFLQSAWKTDTTGVESDVFLSLQSHEMRKLCLFMLFTSCLYLLPSVMLSVPTTLSSASYTQPNLGAISCVWSVLNLRACTACPPRGRCWMDAAEGCTHCPLNLAANGRAMFIVLNCRFCAILFFFFQTVHSFIGKNRGNFAPVTEGVRLLGCSDASGKCLLIVSTRCLNTTLFTSLDAL